MLLPTIGCSLPRSERERSGQELPKRSRIVSVETNGLLADYVDPVGGAMQQEANRTRARDFGH
jgi:hypothetical protein